MKLVDFLRAVTPSDGLNIAAWKVERSEPRGRKFTTFQHRVTKGDPDELALAIRTLVAQPTDIYFALASFKQGFHTITTKTGKRKKVVRVRENVQSLKALWLDIDFKTQYADPVEALQAVRDFCTGAGFPMPTIVVHSGNGVHVYWPFDRPLEVDVWQKLADKFKAAVANSGLAADLVCTADSCRILRPPSTYNFKNPDDIKDVEVIYGKGELYNPLLLAQALSSAPVPDVPAHLRNHAADYDGLDQSGTGAPSIDSSFDEIVKHCAVAKYALDSGGKDASEPEWTAVLQLLKHCEDGDMYVHDVSSGHPGYDERETNYKYESRKENNAGPTLCKTFEKYRPELCQKCPHFQKIKTPLVLGVEQAEGTPEGITLTTWRPVKDGSGMERKMYDPDTQTYEWVKALYRQYRNVEATRSVTTRFFELKFEAGSGDDWIEVVMPSGHLGNTYKLKEGMANFGIPLRNTEVQPFVDFMATWLEKLQEAKKVEDVTERLGWIHSADADDNHIIGFSAGSTSYYTDGSKRQGVRISREFQAVGRVYTPKGSEASWKQVVQFLTEQGNPAFLAIVASAFGAPLLRFTGIQGGILSIVSEESGVGKSSALRAAQAVWGSPSEGLNSVDDTRLSVARKMGFLNNLPAYWDELRGHKTIQDFLTLAFQVSQGKEKTRLDSSAAMREIQTWETMLIAASNESIFDAMGQFTGISDAGTARTFEIEVEPFESTRSRAEVAIMFEALNQNYGYAGQRYAEYLAANVETVSNRVREIFTKMGEGWGMRPAERFWFAMMAALVAGAESSNAAGLTNMDTKALARFLHKNLLALRGRAATAMENNSAEELVAAYIQAHQDRMLVIDEFPKECQNSKTYEPTIRHPPKADRIVIVRGGYGEYGNRYRFTYHDFVAWLLASKNISLRSIRDEMKHKLGMRYMRVSLGLGTRWALPATKVIEVTPPESTGAEVLDDV